MDKKKQLDHWKKLYNDWDKRETELGEALTGEKIYIFELLTYIEPAVCDLYGLDESDWNLELILDYISGSVDYDTFTYFIVEEGGSYTGLNAISGAVPRYWRTPYLVTESEVDAHEG